MRLRRSRACSATSRHGLGGCGRRSLPTSKPWYSAAWKSLFANVTRRRRNSRTTWAGGSTASRCGRTGTACCTGSASGSFGGADGSQPARRSACSSPRPGCFWLIAATRCPVASGDGAGWTATNSPCSGRPRPSRRCEPRRPASAANSPATPYTMPLGMAGGSPDTCNRVGRSTGRTRGARCRASRAWPRHPKPPMTIFATGRRAAHGDVWEEPGVPGFRPEARLVALLR